MKDPKKSPNASSLSSPDVDRAEANLKLCLRGLDRKGEDGLQEALDRIYPETAGVERIEFMSSSHAIADRRYPAKSRRYK